LALAAACLIQAPGAGFVARAASPLQGGDSLSAAARNNIKQAIAAVGLILVRGGRGYSLDDARPRGSGVVIRSDGIVATNYHVIFDGRSGEMFEEILFSLSSEGPHPARNRFRLTPLLVSKEQDLALLSIDTRGDKGMTFPAIEIGDSKSIEVGDDLVIIGYPEKGGLSITVNRGQVSGKDLLKNWIKTDARVIHGNSGGAAVNREGKLVGIPTRVVAESQPIDRNGDGFPDHYESETAVGFLRPSWLVSAMIERLSAHEAKSAPSLRAFEEAAAPTVKVRGVVRSVGGGPIAGAMVGLCPEGSQTVSPANLLSWGGANPDGEFVLNNPVPPGRYTLRAKALGFKPFTAEVEIKRGAPLIEIEMQEERGR
jgi:S1-C subfamily serine protease